MLMSNEKGFVSMLWRPEVMLMTNDKGFVSTLWRPEVKIGLTEIFSLYIFRWTIDYGIDVCNQPTELTYQ